MARSTAFHHGKSWGRGPVASSNSPRNTYDQPSRSALVVHPDSSMKRANSATVTANRDMPNARSVVRRLGDSPSKRISGLSVPTCVLPPSSQTMSLLSKSVSLPARSAALNMVQPPGCVKRPGNHSSRCAASATVSVSIQRPAAFLRRARCVPASVHVETRAIAR